MHTRQHSAIELNNQLSSVDNWMCFPNSVLCHSYFFFCLIEFLTMISSAIFKFNLIWLNQIN